MQLRVPPRTRVSPLPPNPWEGTLPCDVVSRDAHHIAANSHTLPRQSTPPSSPPTMSMSSHAERSGPKQPVSSLIHPEHGINKGAVDSLARQMLSRLSTHPHLSPADVFNDLVFLEAKHSQPWHLWQQRQVDPAEEILYLRSIKTATAGTSKEAFSTSGFPSIRRHWAVDAASPLTDANLAFLLFGALDNGRDHLSLWNQPHHEPLSGVVTRTSMTDPVLARAAGTPPGLPHGHSLESIHGCKFLPVAGPTPPTRLHVSRAAPDLAKRAEVLFPRAVLAMLDRAVEAKELDADSTDTFRQLATYSMQAHCRSTI